MPSFTFTSPEGKQYTVNGPDGATQDQAWAILQQQLSASGTQSTPTGPVDGTGRPWQDDPVQKAGRFVKESLQSGGRMLVHAATGIPGIFANGAAALVNEGANALGYDAPIKKLPTQDLDERLEPALGKAPPLASVGGVAEAIGSGVLTPGAPATAATEAAESAIAPTVTRGQQLATLAREGVRLDNAQAMPSRLATTAKLVANDGPFGDAAAFRQAQAGDFTAAALRQMGISDAREATPAVMQAGKQALKDTYNAVAARNGVGLDDQLARDWDRIRADATSSLTPENARVITNKLDDMLTMMERGGSRLTGEAYQKLQSSLGQIAKDGGKAPFVTELRQALTNAMQRQAQEGDAQLLARTNQRYAAMKAIEKAVDDNNQVSPAKLFNALDTVKNANQSVYGQGPNQPLIQLAQAGKAILSKDVANSGTPQRVAALTAATSAGAAIMGLATGHFDTAAELTSAAVAAGFSQKAAQALAYTQGGRQWLQRWAQAQAAAGRAGNIVAPVARGGALGAAETANNQ